MRGGSGAGAVLPVGYCGGGEWGRAAPRRMEPLQNGGGEEEAEAAPPESGLESAADQRPRGRRRGGGAGRAEAAAASAGRERERPSPALRPRHDSLRKNRPREWPLGGLAPLRGKGAGLSAGGGAEAGRLHRPGRG